MLTFGYDNVHVTEGDAEDYPSQRTIVIIGHLLFLPNSSTTSEKTMIEYRKSPGLLNLVKPGILNVKKNPTNCETGHRCLEGKRDVMAAPQMSQFREGCSCFYNSCYNILPTSPPVVVIPRDT